MLFVCCVCLRRVGLCDSRMACAAVMDCQPTSPQPTRTTAHIALHIGNLDVVPAPAWAVASLPLHLCHLCIRVLTDFVAAVPVHDFVAYHTQ
jgi:hypothetical protein